MTVGYLDAEFVDLFADASNLVRVRKLLGKSLLKTRARASIVGIIFFSEPRTEEAGSRPVLASRRMWRLKTPDSLYFGGELMQRVPEAVMVRWSKSGIISEEKSRARM